MSDLKFGFELRKIRLPLNSILPVRRIKEEQKRVSRYKTILASVKEVGLVEPLVVYPVFRQAQPGQAQPQRGHHGRRAAQEGVTLRQVRHQALKPRGVPPALLAVPARVFAEHIVNF